MSFPVSPGWGLGAPLQARSVPWGHPSPSFCWADSLNQARGQGAQCTKSQRGEGGYIVIKPMRLGELQKSLLSDVLTVTHRIAPARCSEAVSKARHYVRQGQALQLQPSLRNNHGSPLSLVMHRKEYLLSNHRVQGALPGALYMPGMQASQRPCKVRRSSKE